MKKYLPILCAALLFTSCKKDELEPTDDNELVTRVQLTFTEVTSKASLTYTFQDKDGDPNTAPASLFTTTILDKDNNGLPVGLSSSVVTSASAGTGKLNLLLKHQPELNGVKVKTGQEAGGSTDIDLLFDVEIN